MKQPLCRCCGKPIKKFVRTVYIETDVQPGHKDTAYSRYIFAPEGLRTKEECQRLTNGTVVSIKRSHRSETIRWFGEWDGESYVDLLFCTHRCAERFGRMCANTTDIHTQAYANAVKASREDA